MSGITLTELYESDIKNLLKQHDPDLWEYFKKNYKKVEQSDFSDYPKCSICGSNQSKTITLCFEHYSKLKKIQEYFA